MNIYEAAKEMRKFTELEIPFSFSFMSFSFAKDESHGIVEVHKAKLRHRVSVDKHPHSEIIEEYTDLATGEQKHFYLPLLMFFNNQKITI
jgi:hypothetical protein